MAETRRGALVKYMKQTSAFSQWGRLKKNQGLLVLAPYRGTWNL